MIYQELDKFTDRKEPFALVAVVEKIGSGPVSPDSRMAVSYDDLIGTVGGGVLEARAREKAISCLKNGKTEIIHFILREDGNVDLICGGEVKLLIKPFLPENPDYELIEKAIKHLKQEKEVCMAYFISPTEGTYIYTDSSEEYANISGDLVLRARELCHETLKNKKSRYITDGELSVFFEVITHRPRLVLFGGGHVSYYLSKIASLNGFSITVIDDRPEYANMDRFPEAERVISGEYEDISGNLNFNDNTYVVIQTRSHEIDRKILRKIIDSDAKYIGMIGSRRKVNLIFKSLREEGVSEDLLQKVRAPVGLDIGSETPPEIAVSIMAQIIMERRKN